MKKLIAIVLSVLMVLSLGVTAFAADGDIEAVVTEVAVGDNTVYVYAPESDMIMTSTCTAPCFIVFGDEAYTAETAEAEAVDTGLAALAAREGATVVFVNPQGDTWSDADFDVYPSLIGLYSDSSTDVFEDGLAHPVNFFTGEEETKILGAYQARIYLYAEGAGADFVAANYMKALVLTTVFGDGFAMEFDRTPTTVTLFNPTALPEAEDTASIAVAVVNGPDDAAEKLEGLTDKTLVDTSDVTDGFDGQWIADNYGVLSGAYRSQAGVILPMHDYAAEGIVESIESFTLADDSTVNYAVYYDEELPVTGDADPVPLVMAFHGGGNTALFEAQASEWPEIAQTHGFIAVCVDRHDAFSAPQMVELLDHLKEEYAIDATRVYASGFSMGSIRSWDMFEQFPTVFAGVAPMDGANPPGVTDFSTELDSYNTDVLVPVFYVGGQTSPLVEMANQDDNEGNKIEARIAYAFGVNDVEQEYSYDADVNEWWGVNGDVVYEITDQAAFTDSTLTVNLFKSADGNYYTALADSSNQSHEVYARNSWAAWDFLSQFSRNEDGSVTVSPVTYTLPSDDGAVVDNNY